MGVIENEKLDVESQVIGQIAVERRALSNGVETIWNFLVVSLEVGPLSNGGGQGRGVCGCGRGVGVVNNPKLPALGTLGLGSISELMHFHT